MCEKDHIGHDIISYGRLLPNEEDIKNKIIELKNKIDEYKNYIHDIIIELTIISNKLDNYFNINIDITRNFEFKKRNYLILTNLNNIETSIKDFLEDINNNKIHDLKNILNIHALLVKKQENAIKTKTEINEEHNKENREIIKKEDEEKNEKNIVIEHSMEENINKNEINLTYGNYENFNLNQMKEINSFQSLTKSSKIFVLKDGRLLLYYDQMINVYDINNKNSLDIIYNIDSKYGKIEDLIQMNDGNIIVIVFFSIYLFKINQYKIELISRDVFTNIVKMFKISNDTLLFKAYKDALFYFYEYKNSDYNKLNEKPIKIKGSYDICLVNKNELAFLCKSKNMFSSGFDTTIVFYDREKAKKGNEIKIGKVENESEKTAFSLINENILITANNKSIVLINVKSHEKINEIPINKNIFYSSIVLLNKYNFLFVSSDSKYENYNSIIHYIINENMDCLSEKNKTEYSLSEGPDDIQKYYENKLIFKYENKILITG